MLPGSTLRWGLKPLELRIGFQRIINQIDHIASIGIGKDKWRVEVYGQNLTNSHASVFTSSAQFIVSEVPLRPRVVGGKLGVKF